MKIEKKYIIILIVVAVAAFLLWRRYKESKANTGETSEKVPVTRDVNAILKAIGASDAQKDSIRSIVRKINATPEWKRSLEEKAEEEDLSYEQEAVMAAVWTVYMVKGDDGEYHERHDGDSDIAYNLISKVKNL